MGKHDRRHSPKMRRRKRQRALKERVKRCKATKAASRAAEGKGAGS